MFIINFIYQFIMNKTLKFDNRLTSRIIKYKLSYLQNTIGNLDFSYILYLEL